MKNIIKHSWRDVSINEYFELKERLNEISEIYEREIYLISFTNNIPEDEIYNMPILKVKALQENLKWMNSFDISPNVKFKKISINDSKYVIETDLQKFTVAQYIDFQTFYPKRTENKNYIGNLLACFIIPKGYKYNEGYDINELINYINENVDIMTAHEIIFFFLKQYLISIRALQNYFNWQMKILKKITPKKKMAKFQKLQDNWNQMQKNISDGFHLLTT